MEVNELFKHRSITALHESILRYRNERHSNRSSSRHGLPMYHLQYCWLSYSTFLLPNKSLHDWGEVNPMASFILQTIIYGATLVMAVVSFWHLLPQKATVS